MISLSHLERTCHLEGLDTAAGLDKTEQRYLRLLAQTRDKPIRLNVISSVLGLPSRTIADVTEKVFAARGTHRPLRKRACLDGQGNGVRRTAPAGEQVTEDGSCPAEHPKNCPPS